MTSHKVFKRLALLLFVALVEAYESDPRVVAYYGWIIRREDVNGNTPCEVFLDWDTGEITEIGRAFAGD